MDGWKMKLAEDFSGMKLKKKKKEQNYWLQTGPV